MRQQAGTYYCDAPECMFNTAEPIWNGQELKLTVDHKNGVNSDDRLRNLQLLCPNCSAQLSTHGGRNRGRVRKSAGGFAILNKESGLNAYTLVAESGKYEITGGAAPKIVEVTLENLSDESGDR